MPCFIVLFMLCRRCQMPKDSRLGQFSDLLQLIDNHTEVYRFKTGFSDIQIFDIDKMVEIYGLHPTQWVDYKAIRGDLSDNIPGVPGIGEKGALDLIKTFGSLEGVYEGVERNSEKIKPGTLKKLVEGKPKAYLSQKLAHIDRKNHLDFDFERSEEHTSELQS